MASHNTYSAGDLIVQSIYVYDNDQKGKKPVASVGPVRGRFVKGKVGIGDVVTLDPNASGADWNNGVYVFEYSAALSAQLADDFYRISLRFDDIEYTAFSEEIEIVPAVF